MRFFGPTLRARFIRRPNRFLIRCEWKRRALIAFLPNPGRLQELLLPGSTIHLMRERNPNDRKTAYTAVAVEREGHPIMLHTHRTNAVVRYLLERGKVPGLNGARVEKSEVQVGRSRFDFLLTRGDQTILLEVKSCTLVGKRVAMFPDAITARGTRHLEELAALSRTGVQAAVLFVVHWPFARRFMPDYHTDLHFAETLLRVRDNVQVLPIAIRWGTDLGLLPTVRALEIPWQLVQREARDRGSYLLLLILKKDVQISVGSLGTVRFRKGFYIYVGSAMAHLTQRMSRHRRLLKQHHWHIDELRAVAGFHASLAIRSSTRLECEIARAFSEIAQWGIPGFGCSDCHCPTHLFGMTSDPLQSHEFHRRLQYFRMDRVITDLKERC